MTTERYIVVDIETNGLLYDVTKIHCMVMYDSLEGTFYNYHDDPHVFPHSGSIEDGLRRLKLSIASNIKIVGHNISGYDFPMLLKLGHITYPRFSPWKMSMEDTYINNCLLNPEEPPGLDYWGKKLGIYKPPIEDWSVFNTSVLRRCQEDVKINVALYEKQLKRLKKHDWTKAQDLEMKVNWIHAMQTLNGIRIDILKAEAVLEMLDQKIHAVEHSIHQKLKMVTVTGDTIEKPFKKDGSLTVRARDWFGKAGVLCLNDPEFEIDISRTHDGVRVMGPFSKVEFEKVNLNSHDKVKEILTELGWQPTEWNYKKNKKGQLIRDAHGQLIPTSPKLTEDSYDSLPEGLGKEITEFLVLNHRRRFILNDTDTTKGLLSFVRPESMRAPADAFTCGTNTARYRHKGALVNLPRPKSAYGVELRSLFTVTKGNLMIGIDIAGIEARVMAHYAYFYDKGRYRETVLDLATGKEKDIHEENAKILGCSRDTAKSFLYAISYGAGAKKLASILKVSVPEGKALVEKYWDTHWGLKNLRAALEHEYRSTGSHIIGLDGRKLYIRGEHKLLNTLVQGAAAVIFKRWMVSCWEATWDDPFVQQLLAYHDELAWELAPGGITPEDFSTDMIDLLVQVGIDMELNVPLNGEAKVGINYAEVH